MQTAVFPFTAIVGQESMKRALLMNVIYPAIGGVLIRGERGTAKSTVVRGLASLLPPIRVVKDCPFHCHPTDPNRMCPHCVERFRRGERLQQITRPRKVVNLPIGVTEDRLLGTLDLETALTEGRKRFEPGLLAEANRAFLYVDEVNLLSDHIVDLLLDVAAMGVNHVEREGLSFVHPSNFILVGTMNPEEGDLRPQLLDRFGLCVEVEGLKDFSVRAEIIQRRLEFERGPEDFIRSWKPREEEMARSLEQARRRLDQVKTSAHMVELAGRLSLGMGAEGHRADLTIIKGAKAIAALEELDQVSERQLVQAAEMALRHRVRRKGLSETRLDRSKIEQLMDKLADEEDTQSPPPPEQIKKKIKLL